MKLDLETRAIDNVTVLYCKGRFTYRDEATAFSQKIAELLPHARQLIVELSGLEAIDSAGLGALVRGNTSAQNRGATIKLANLTKTFHELLTITKLVTFFDTYGSVDDAVNSFAHKASAAG